MGALIGSKSRGVGRRRDESMTSDRSATADRFVGNGGGARRTGAGCTTRAACSLALFALRSIVPLLLRSGDPIMTHVRAHVLPKNASPVLVARSVA
jgi:hypothetical protein